MKKIKIAALFISAALALIMIGCSGAADSNTDTPADETETSASETPALTYTVTYVDGVDGVEIAMPSDTTAYHSGDTVTVRFTGIGERSGYAFTGWSDGTTTYTSSGTTSFSMGSANVTLTAQWQAYIGTKAPAVAKEVGDIVFKDGSAMPYTSYDALPEGQEKNAKKASAIAVIFYKGTGLNSDGNGTPVSTTSRTLGIGLQSLPEDAVYLNWCRITSDTDKASVLGNNNEIRDIDTIMCNFPQTNNDLVNYTNYSFSGDKNGSDNLEKIADYLTANNITNDTGVRGSATTAEQAALNYPAFYFAKNYKNVEGSNVNGTAYETGWYLPSIAELYEIDKNGIVEASREFNLNAVIRSLNGDEIISLPPYWSSSFCVGIENNNSQGENPCTFISSYVFTTVAGNQSFSQISILNDLFYVCAIREFN